METYSGPAAAAQLAVDPAENGNGSAEPEGFPRIAALIEGAQSLAEVQGATAELRVWVREHPEEKDRLAAVFSHLFLLEEGAREAEAEAEAMGLSAKEIRQRERLMLLRLHVHGEDPPEVFRPALQKARKALEAWWAAHPDDPQLPILAAHLDLEQQIASFLRETV